MSPRVIPQKEREDVPSDRKARFYFCSFGRIAGAQKGKKRSHLSKESKIEWCCRVFLLLSVHRHMLVNVPPFFSWCQKCVNFSSAAMYFVQSAACSCRCSKCSINYTAASLKKKKSPNNTLSPLVGLIGSLQLHQPRRRRKKK